MRVLVTFAVDAEFAPWRRRHSFKRQELSVPHSYRSDAVYTGRVNQVSVDVYLTGMGWTGVRAGLYHLLSKKPHLCISSGLAGGLKPSLKSGQIVAARRISGSQGGGTVKARERLLSIAEEVGATIVDDFITSTQIVSQAQFKKDMGEFADVVEMESYHVLTMATGPQVASIAIRAISDTVDEDMPLDFGKVLEPDGRLNLRKLALQVGRYPHRIPALLKFGKRSERATMELADFLDRYIEAVGAKSPHWFSTEVAEVSAT
jgi:nucleoside phosphorylase